MKFTGAHRVGANYVDANLNVQCPKTPESIQVDVRLDGPKSKYNECGDYSKIASGIDISCPIPWQGHEWHNYSYMFSVAKDASQGGHQGGSPVGQRRRL